MMNFVVREMAPEESDLVIDYFHRATPEHLEMLGVDPTRLPPPDAWREHFQEEFARPVETRVRYYLAWLLDGRPIGYSSCDKIIIGERANMHLHVVEAGHRRRGFGSDYVRRSVDLYFERLRLKKLYCEPNAFNVAPNRALQRAGFKYLKTHMTVPGQVNFHQPVTQWLIER